MKKAPSFVIRPWLLVALLLLPALVYSQSPPASTSWATARKDKKGTLVLYWYESRPFIFPTGNGALQGIEYDLVEDFKRFVRNRYHVELTMYWKEGHSFDDTYNTIRTTHQPGVVGVSAFSITPYRQAEVGFTRPYMPDICVLITSHDIPAAPSIEAFKEELTNLTAITIKGTTYEKDLIRLRQEIDTPFAISYIHSSENILRHVASHKRAFGLIDLPVYMMNFKEDPSIAVRRQNMFTTSRDGYAFIFPQGSDWAEPLDAYFTSPEFKSNLRASISKYIDIDLYDFIETLASQSDSPLSLLEKEKEIQNAELLQQQAELLRGERSRDLLVVIIALTCISLVIIIGLYRKRNQQKRKIEKQQQNIASKNQQLENRNQQLEQLDEEKNNLIRILAHDMRAPINHIQGLTQLVQLTAPDQSHEHKQLIGNIADSAHRLSTMITNILDIDALENNRIKMTVEQTALMPILLKALSSLQERADQKAITINVTGDTSGEVYADGLYLTQVFENLISNALKFSNKGTTVTINISESDDEVRVAVSDQGQGLTEEDQKNLFKKFTRLSAIPTQGESSTGLGLSIVKKYVDAMNGQVWCDSVKGKGATFTVVLCKSAVSSAPVHN